LVLNLLDLGAKAVFLVGSVDNPCEAAFDFALVIAELIAWSTWV
jgi:hypothetical protein